MLVVPSVVGFDNFRVRAAHGWVSEFRATVVVLFGDDGCRLGACFARFVSYATTREWCSVCMGRLDPCFGQRRLTLHAFSFVVQEQSLPWPSRGFPVLRTYREGIRLSHRPSFV